MSNTGLTPPPKYLLLAILVIGITGNPGSSLSAQSSTDSEPMADESAPIRFGRTGRMGAFSSPQISESSGLAASARYPGCYWTHNDNGRSPGLFLVQADGKHVATLQIQGAEYFDWEALATVRRNEQNLIVIGDVGDNLARRESYRLFVLPEPELAWTNDPDEPIEMETDQFETILFRYPDGPQDCEALGVEPSGRRIWLVSKQRPGGPGAQNGGGRNGGLAKTAIHYLDWPESIDQQQLMATRLESKFDKLMVTGMDFSRDGKSAVIRTYFSAHLFKTSVAQAWDARLAGIPDLDSAVPIQRQGEAIAFDLDGSGVLLTSEGFGQPIWRMPLVNSGEQK